MKSLLAWPVIAFVVSLPLAAGVSGQGSMHWYRCNTHTHTSAFPKSDANGTPDFVARWYKEHGYQCVVITDHEHLTDVAALNREHAKDGNFLALRGQEITQILRDPSHPQGVRHAHLNGINIDRAIMPVGYPGPGVGISMADAYKQNVAAVYAAGGIPQINHPNLGWSARLDDLLPLSEPFLLEIWNSFHTSNNLGGTDDAGALWPSTEGLWDGLLSRGKIVWGVSSDDVHEYYKLDDRESPTPGKAWIVLRAPSLTVDNVMDAFRNGRFYASTGIVLESYIVDGKAISMTFVPPTNWNSTSKAPTRYTTRFIGANGRVLAEVPGVSPHYRFKGDEQYVRASITDSDGRKGWTQPVFLDGRKAPRQ